MPATSRKCNNEPYFSKRTSKKHLTAFVLFAAVAAAQDTPANPLVTVSKNMYAIAKNDILGSVNKVPDELWSFQPTPEVRTFAQLFAHVADGQYEFCGAAAGGESPAKALKSLKRPRPISHPR